MELKLVEDRDRKEAMQERLIRNLRAAWAGRETRQVAWRPGKVEADISHDGTNWVTTRELRSPEKTPRHWNSFGQYASAGSLQITVEINIPTVEDSDRVAGFFAEDALTGAEYLMHDGGIGGGRRGVGREAFLLWSGGEMVPVIAKTGNVRHGLLVAPLDAKRIGAHVARFVRRVADFKNAVTAGEVSEPSETVRSTYADYFREFSGTKKGEREQEFEYVSRHGDIVHALSMWRKGSVAGEAERVVKNANIDLGIANADNRLTELYEVKTNGDRQSLYTAIGQLLVHGSDDVCRFVVVPAGSALPSDVLKAMERLRIRLLRFEIGESIKIIG